MSSGFLSPLFFMGLANFGEYVPPPTVVPDVGFVNGLYVQITVTNYHGVPLGELAADVESVTWLLNEAGRARLDVPNPGTAAELIQFGNRVLIEFDNGLADWTGYIDPPRRWRYGSAMLTVYGGVGYEPQLEALAFGDVPVQALPAGDAASWDALARQIVDSDIVYCV